MKAVQTERNHGFDFLKYICAFLVVCIHTEHDWQYAVVVARAAVPVFFMITGFFYSTVLERGREKAQICKILKLAVSGSIFYMLWTIVSNSAGTRNPLTLLRAWGSGYSVLRFVLWNVSPFRSHLWYLSALLYVLIIAGVLDKYQIRKKVYWLIPVLLGGNLLLGNYAGLVFGGTTLLAHSRNYLFVGLPCFLLGDLLYQRRDAKKLPNRLLWLLLEVSIAGSLIEYEVMIRTPNFINQDFFAWTIVTAYAAFSLVKNNSAWFENPVMRKIAWMGKELSLGIYIFHAAIRMVTEKLLQIIGGWLPAVERVYGYGSPLVMLVIDSCVVFAYLWIAKKARAWRDAKRTGSDSSG